LGSGADVENHRTPWFRFITEFLTSDVWDPFSVLTALEFRQCLEIKTSVCWIIVRMRELPFRSCATSHRNACATLRAVKRKRMNEKRCLYAKLLTQNSLWDWEIFCGLEISRQPELLHGCSDQDANYETVHMLNFLVFLLLLSNFIFR
jgi:hypothetical protein